MIWEHKSKIIGREQNKIEYNSTCTYIHCKPPTQLIKNRHSKLTCMYETTNVHVINFVTNHYSF